MSKVIPNLHFIVPNKTTKYLIYSLAFENKLIFSMLESFGLINVYLSIHEYPLLTENDLVLLMNPSKEMLNKWYKFYDVYSKERRFQWEKDIGVNTIVLSFKIAEKYKNFKKYFINGGYSKMNTENYADNFVVTRGYNKLEVRQEYKIITKNQEYRLELQEKLNIFIPSNYELDEKPILENEILKIDKILI